MTETAAIADSLVSVGLAEDPARLRFAQLEGGVSSDIWRVDGAASVVCVKRARPRLAVAATWEVPVERNHYEAEFLRVVSEEVPGFAPELLAEDEAQGLIVLPFLDPGTWRLWKTQLLAGEVDLAVARTAGTHLGRLARATRGRPDLAERFATLRSFLRPAARPLPDGMRAPPPRSRRPAHGFGRRHVRAARGPCARGRQPEEHARYGGGGVPDPRCRMRLVRRPGLRSRLPGQPPLPQVRSRPGGGGFAGRGDRGCLSRGPKPTRRTRPPRSSGARRGFCRVSCWRGLMANHRSST
jgi:hypothetical protein